MIAKVNINDFEEIVITGLESGKNIKIYYPLFDTKELAADYSAEVTMQDKEIIYNFGGHGIRNSSKKLLRKEDLLERIVQDNLRFNNGKEFHIQIAL